MPVANFNTPILDRKEWQMMTPSPVASAAGTFVVSPPSGWPDLALLMSSATVHYLYSHKEDGFMQITSGALAGTFAAGACGAYHPWSINYTANGGSTTTVTVAAATHNITAEVVGKTIEFLTGTAGNIGTRRVITGIRNDAGSGTVTLTLESAVTTVVSTDTFRITSGRFFILNAGTQAAGSFKVFDVGTMAWQANLTITGLPASWGTDGRLVTTARNPQVYGSGTATGGSTTTLEDTGKIWTDDEHVGRYVTIVDGTGEGQTTRVLSNDATTLTFAVMTAVGSGSVYRISAQRPIAIGTATAGSSTTVTNSGKTWTTNQWANCQVRIVSGTGVGQTRAIASNTSTVLTTASFGTAPDSTSVYVIEPNDDYIYAIGNNAVTMYRYSISGNSWSTVSPGVARGGAPVAGMWADFVDFTGEAQWGNESDIQEGRYIYSGRGTSAVIDRYDIALNAWAVVTVVGSIETFTTGSAGFQSGRFIYLRKDATNRFFKYDIPGNQILPFNTNQYPDGAAVIGNKIWVKSLDTTDNVQWVYSLMNTGTALQRIGII